MKRYGFFSAVAFRCHGGVYWSRPEGGEALVTCVCKEETGQGYIWPDKVAVGEVGQYLRQARHASDDYLGIVTGAESTQVYAITEPAAMPVTNPDMRPESERERKHRTEQADKKVIADMNRKSAEDRKRKLEGVGVVAPIRNRVGMVV
jgi:hypothetical protein